jgi:hypothetical protein
MPHTTSFIPPSSSLVEIAPVLLLLLTCACYVQMKDDKVSNIDNAVSQEHARIEMDKESGAYFPTYCPTYCNTSLPLFQLAYIVPIVRVPWLRYKYRVSQGHFLYLMGRPKLAPTALGTGGLILSSQIALIAMSLLPISTHVHPSLTLA